MTLFKAPFPWFGGKSRVAALVWSRLDDTPNYVEPFFGSGAVLLGRPGWSPQAPWIETVNDGDGFVANFWRALQHEPEQVAQYADSPINENDLHARHVWLRERRDSLTMLLEGDPDYYDAKIAGWWVWGLCCWIGGGWCDPDTVGPWGVVIDENGSRRFTHLGDGGRGVSRRRVHLRPGMGVKRQLVHLGNAGFSNDGTGQSGLVAWMEALAARLARVRVCSGDWSRVMGESVTIKNGLTAVFLDPPYGGDAGRDNQLYAHEDLTVAHNVREWCIANGDQPLLRIALCGLDTEHSELMDHGWTKLEWIAHGGYAHQRKNGPVNENRKRETIWFSPHCLRPEKAATQMRFNLFDDTDYA